MVVVALPVVWDLPSPNLHTYLTTFPSGSEDVFAFKVTLRPLAVDVNVAFGPWLGTIPS